MLATAIEFSLNNPPEWLRSIGKLVIVGGMLIWVLHTLTSSMGRDDRRDRRDR